MKKTSLVIIVSLIFGFSGSAQEENGEPETIPNIFQGTRLVNEQSANLLDQGKLSLFIQHRFGQIDGGIYELFGLDQATMRLGFEYGLGQNLNVGFGRSSFLKTWDIYSKAAIARQTTEFPLTIAASASAFMPTLRNYYPEENDSFGDKTGWNILLHLARTMNMTALQVSPGYMSTGFLLSENEQLSLITLGLGGSLKISKKVSANVEYLTWFNSELSSNKPLSLGFDIDTGGHIFQLIFSNSQQMFSRALYTHTMGDWSKGDIFFGFNLIREFRLKYY